MCMGLKWELDGDEVKFLRPGHNRLQVKYESRGLDGGEPGWNSGAVLVTWMEMRHEMDRGETHISRHGWGWDGTWIKLRCNRRDLNGGEMRPVCRRDTNIGIWTEVRRDLDGGEMHIWRPRWVSDVIWMELRCSSHDRDGCETQHQWRGCVHIGTFMHLNQVLDGGETTQTGWRWVTN